MGLGGAVTSVNTAEVVDNLPPQAPAMARKPPRVRSRHSLDWKIVSHENWERSGFACVMLDACSRGEIHMRTIRWQIARGLLLLGKLILAASEAVIP